uniref:KASH domain-containing protein n=1 Tax=Clastoptera arizonana TaxID=38151 RepID=A0A1B6CNR0_9HEMI
MNEELVKKWEMLQVKAEDLLQVERKQKLQAEISSLKDEFVNLANRVMSIQFDSMTDREQLELRIQQVKGEMSFLRDRKSQLVKVHRSVNEFMTDTKEPGDALKDGVTDLYQVWNETSQKVGHHLNNLQQLSSAWQQFDLNLSELQLALRGDHETLKQLDSAVQEGSITPDLATSVRDVAKVLSEKPEFSSTVVLDDTTTLILTTPICTEGSLSDSGISDSGSEQDLNERERRLAALRRLARSLESILSPGSQVIADIAKRIEQTEKELRELQQTCRDLVIKTAVCAEATAQGRNVQNINSAIATQPTSQRNLSATRRKKATRSMDPDDPDPDKSSSWIWRVMRTAVPFQMAIVAIFCVACLMEPHCCDTMNNLNFSLVPQLRYIRGPPPV